MASMQWLGRWSNAVRIAALGAAFSVPGCFRDQPTAIDRICPDGENTCPCRDGQECSAGLTCMADGRCRDPRCTDGRPGCACVDGVGCDPGLECRDMSCLLPDDGESTSSSGAADSISPGTTDPTVTSGPVSASDPSVGTTFDPSMTDSSLDTGIAEVGPVTFGESGMSSDTMTMESCHCGWRTDASFYACGLDTLPYDPDPEDAYPYECPNGTWDLYASSMSGAVAISCDSTDPAIEVQGCCLDATINVWCSLGQLVFESCDELHPWCV